MTNINTIKSIIDITSGKNEKQSGKIFNSPII